MNSSVKLTKQQQLGGRDQPIAGAGGIDSAPLSKRDPYDVLEELMAVVEELCPTWPVRDTFEKHQIFLL